MNNVKVSVIIPVYNIEPYLQECLDSVMTQTLKEIEIICIDDGSTDNCLLILKQNASFDDRIIIIEQKNQGAGVARNSGIDIATGEYIAFMDPDDLYIDNDTLRDLYDAVIISKCNIVGGSLAVIRNNEIITKFSDEKQNHVFLNNEYKSFCDYQQEFYFQKFLYKRKFLSKYNIKFPCYRMYEDPPFLVIAMIASKNFYVISRISYLYRTSHKTVNWNTVKICDMLNGINDVIELAMMNNLYILLNKSLMRFEGMKKIYQCELEKNSINENIKSILLKINRNLANYNIVSHTSILSNQQTSDINLVDCDVSKLIEKYQKGKVRKNNEYI